MKHYSFASAYIQAPDLFYKEQIVKPNTMLLESAEIISKRGTQSMMGARACLKIICEGLKVTVKALNANGSAALKLIAAELKPVSSTPDCLSYEFQPAAPNTDEMTRLKAPGPFDVLRAIRKACFMPASSLMGVIAFDFITNFEAQLPKMPGGLNTAPDFSFFLFDLFVHFDHIHKKSTLHAYVYDEDSKADTILEALSLKDKLDNFTPETKLHLRPVRQDEIARNPHLSDAEFGAMAAALKQHIYDGEAFQVVPSRIFSLPCPDPLLCFSYVKALNPSPYMFFIQDEEYAIFGASPEYALRYDAASNEVSISPIAGTRARGVHADGSLDPDLDARIELELRTDTKETAEHLMLVDLARNDLAHISRPQTRVVENILHVERYQNVMHLVSDVKAQLNDGLDGLYAYQAAMNMGTLSGAPKIKAHELIYRYEGTRRGSYGGTVAILKDDGSFDSCITIRSAFVRDGTAYVQAGCGVVFDSNEQSECDETFNKARAVLNAITLANQQ